MSLLEAANGADLTRIAEPTPEPKIITTEQRQTLRDLGVHWLVAENAVDLCLIGDTPVAFVVGGSLEDELCDAWLGDVTAKKSEQDDSAVKQPGLELITTEKPVTRPEAKIRVWAKLWERYTSTSADPLRLQAS